MKTIKYFTKKILIEYNNAAIREKRNRALNDMLPSYRTMKYKSPIWGYFHVQKE